MPKNVTDILYQDKWHLTKYSNASKHSLVILRPKVKVIIHDKNKNELLLLQEPWEKDYGYFLPEDVLYEDVLDSEKKTHKDTIKDALDKAITICKCNGVLPKDLKLFLEDFRGNIHCTYYYYFLVTNFEEIEVETNEFQWRISINEILELVKKNAFYEEEEVGVLFTYLLKENDLVYNGSEG